MQRPNQPTGTGALICLRRISSDIPGDRDRDRWQYKAGDIVSIHLDQAPRDIRAKPVRSGVHVLIYIPDPDIPYLETIVETDTSVSLPNPRFIRRRKVHLDFGRLPAGIAVPLQRDRYAVMSMADFRSAIQSRALAEDRLINEVPLLLPAAALATMYQRRQFLNEQRTRRKFLRLAAMAAGLAIVPRGLAQTLVTRYVDTDVAPGGDGTIGDPVATLAEWESLIDDVPNFVTRDVVEEVICTGATADATTMATGAFTMDDDNYAYIRVADTDRHTGIYSTSLYHRNVGGQFQFWEASGRWYVDGLQWNVTSAGLFVIHHDQGRLALWRNIFHDCTNSMVKIDSGGSTVWLVAYANIFNGCSPAVQIQSGATNSYLYNNTARGIGSSGAGFWRDAGTMYQRNNIVWDLPDGNYYEFTGGWGAFDYNASEDTTGDDFGGTGNLANLSGVDDSFTNPTADELLLDAADTVFKDTGQDLSGNPDSAPTLMEGSLSLDCLGTTRTGSWDRGAHEVPAAPGGGRRRMGPILIGD